LNPKIIFEFGSGYGHSAFWFLKGSPNIEQVVLTEKRTDLLIEFEALNWPANWKEKLKYYQEDAFGVLESYEKKIDMALIDGTKSDYLEFLLKLKPKLTKNALIIIDNSFWRGSFLDESCEQHSAVGIRKFHQYLKESNDLNAYFIPFVDGITLVQFNEDLDN
jgi:predicted O-methyltransferase YrrM